jgi:hypothetical protein
MEGTDIREMLKVVRNHRDALDQLEEELVQGTARGRIDNERVQIVVKGIVLSAAYLDELTSRQRPRSKAAAAV